MEFNELKYMGSKARIAKYIAPFILDHLTTDVVYVEPFAGGMNMVSHINNLHTGMIIAADNNEYLIEMWKALLSGWKPPTLVSRKQYYEIKNNKTETPHLTGWVGFNCSYAGKWFAGYAGVTQTKLGLRDYQSEAINNVQRQLTKLEGVTLRHCNYKELDIPDGAVVYCDPPYVNTTGYQNSFDSIEFWEWVRKLSDKCIVFVSEYTAPDDFDCIWSGELSSNIPGTKTKSIESLFVINRVRNKIGASAQKLQKKRLVNRSYCEVFMAELGRKEIIHSYSYIRAVSCPNFFHLSI
ncbi:DNA adenine methylase [Xenorhabdus eapokensis]|uniref:site-specific DNA-methyltransferase (adenine-specific) n=1 Tax=Xenorhabdus eapokensis TaxID=1873482 RepID=A0A1Q5TN03_9GAMM|nr:DNA adenine methylase [Xenorhabdus eapokensis]OKP01607.1 hypothetical protein Xedl_02883 [Xenorhabdus eapokensis]